jgi:phosphatidylglycerophosphate synthase
VALLILNWPLAVVPLGQVVLAVAATLSLASGMIYFCKFWRCVDLEK